MQDNNLMPTGLLQTEVNRPIAHTLFISVQLILAAGIGFGLVSLGAGGGSWILGGIAAGAIAFFVYRTFYNHQAEPNRNFRKLGQMLVGLTVGSAIAHSNFTTLSLQLPTFIGLAFFLLCSGGVIGYIYARLQKTDVLTALLATVPGNIGVMASIAADCGKNASLVSLVQLIRFTAVTLVIPLLANVATQNGLRDVIAALVQDVAMIDATYLGLLGLLLAIAFLAIYCGGRVRLPVAAFFCSILVGISFNLGLDALHTLPANSFHLPTALNLMGQVLLGITIGEYWGMNPHLEKRAIAYTIVPVVLICLTGFVSAGLARLLTSWDWLTCLLVTAPGGSPEMILIALTINRDVEIVTTGHLVRLIAINLSLPVLVSLSSKLKS